jgi:hypothetical protein
MIDLEVDFETDSSFQAVENMHDTLHDLKILDRTTTRRRLDRSYTNQHS